LRETEERLDLLLNDARDEIDEVTRQTEIMQKQNDSMNVNVQEAWEMVLVSENHFIFLIIRWTFRNS